MPTRLLWWLMGLALSGWPVVASAAEEPLAIVVLSRHGVRSPTQHEATLALWSAKAWPTWAVHRGELSARGAALVTPMGRAYAQLLGLSACPANGEVYLYADVDERTRATGAALATGVSATCPPPVLSGSGKMDALFHPVKAGVCAIDSAKARAAMLATAGGDLARYLGSQAQSLALIQQTLGPTPTALCTAQGVSAPCVLTQLPTGIEPHQAHGRANIVLTGGLALASDAAEVLLLNSIEHPGWEGLGAAALAKMLDAHVAAFGLTQWTPYLAQKRGSALLARLANELARAGTPGAPRLSVLIGHDTNLANIGALLAANWQVADWPLRATPPAGSLVFAVYQGKAGKPNVKVEYWAQPLAELLGGGNEIKPARGAVTLAGCPGGNCSLTALLHALRAAIDPACVP